ncbi:MFS transporter [Haloglomus halophilum]|uniref:MFS transporter n=1 Tax=Haloglomus halophilum TaxID=2962672 RepID=UPI0020C9FA0E|nr:MFS transporter [Haloglomus halophilum]
MADQPGHALVRRYYLYEATAASGFVWPVFTLFLLGRDLSFTEIAALSAVLSVLVVAGEIPTGRLADRLGRRNALLLGRLAEAASLAGFVLAQSFADFLALYALWALGMTLASGTAAAWLYDALDEYLDAGRYTAVRGRGRAIGQWAMAARMVVAGPLYVLDPTYPFIAGAAVGVLSAGVLLGLPEVQDADAEPTGREALALVRDALSRPDVRGVVLYAGLFFGLVSAVDDLIQPIAVDAFDIYLGALPGSEVVPEPALLGVLYAGFTAVAAVASDRAAALERRVGTRAAVVGLPVLVAVAALVPALVTAVAVPVFVVVKSAKATVAPLVSGYLNDRIDRAGRATVLSAAAMAYALVRVPLKLGTGRVADLASPILAVAAVGVAFLVAGAVLVVAARPLVGASEAGAEQAANAEPRD